MKRFSLIIILLVGMISQGLNAQEVLSLKDAISKGLDNNFQIRIMDLTVEQIQNDNNWGTVGRYPSISLGINENNKYENSKSFTNPDTRDEVISNILYPSVNLRWTLFNGFAVKINKQKLDLLEDFTQGNATVVVENTIQAILLAYYNVQLQNEKLNVLSTLKSISRDRYSYIQERSNLGSAVTYDVLQAQNAYLNDSSNYLMQQLNVQNSLLNLSQLMGEESSNKYVLQDELGITNNDYVYNDLLEKMISNNSILKNQYINQEILKKNVGIKKSSLYPIVSLNSGIDQFTIRNKTIGSDPVNTDSYSVYANLSLSFNLFNGGNVKSAIENAKIDQQIGELNIAEMMLSLKNALTNLYELYEIRKQLYNVSVANLEAAELNLEISSDKFRSGAINSFNYRDIQLMYNNAAVQQLESKYNLIDTHTELLRLTGGIIGEY